MISYQLLASKADLLSLIASVNVLSEDNIKLRKEVAVLENHNHKFLSRFIDLEDRARRNDLKV